MIALLCCCLVAPLWAQTALHIIPTPQSVKRLEGHFILDKKARIYVMNEVDAFAAGQLADEIACAGLHRPRFTNKSKAHIHLLRRGADSTLVADWSNSFQDKIGDEGYVLEIGIDGITVSAHTQRGVFYGVQTLRQIIRTQGDTLFTVRIADWPKLQYRGWQDDISRGPIPTLDFLKEQIRILSEYKLNWMTLYTEHVFKLRSHPDIAPADGITAEDVAELQAYAKDYHVEVVGNFQSFGHFRHILKLPAYRHLRETRDVISPAFEESYQFLGDAFGEVAQAYDSPLFNINCDETFGLGTGPARAMKQKLGKAGLYAYHINRVYELFKPYNKRLMMWGDIARDYPEIIPQLPKDLIVLPWAYHAASSFDSEIRPFIKLGFDFMVCPGVSCWRRMWPDFDTAITNIAHFVRDGAKLGAMGMLNTSWDDDGENLFNYHWLPMVWGAEMAWKPLEPQEKCVPEYRLHRFKAAFSPLFYGLPGSTIADLLSAMSDLRRFKAAGNLDDKAFWAPLIPDGDTEEPASDGINLSQTAGNYAGAFDAISAIPSRHAASLKAAAFAARRAAVQGRLTNLRSQLWRLSRDTDRFNVGDLEGELDALSSDVLKLEVEYVQCWELEARPWWLERNQAKYKALAEAVAGLKGHVAIQSHGNEMARRRTVSLTPLFGAEAIYYTTDDSPVTLQSELYESPIIIYGTTVIRARALRKGDFLPEVQQRTEVYEGPVQSISIVHDPEKQYKARGKYSLVDGRRGSTDFRESIEWQGYWYWDFEVVLDLGSVQPVTQLGLGCLQDSRAWIHYPEWVEFELSDDRRNFWQVAHIENSFPIDRDGSEIHDFMSGRLDEDARYIRVLAKNMGTLPAWHRSAGGKSWLFVDEVIIR
ncbi:family 20 glycosylhydrolase [bacterium]|nr:family 20 glycosylhydrolase [bacterium]